MYLVLTFFWAKSLFKLYMVVQYKYSAHCTEHTEFYFFQKGLKFKHDPVPYTWCPWQGLLQCWQKLYECSRKKEYLRRRWKKHFQNFWRGSMSVREYRRRTWLGWKHCKRRWRRSKGRSQHNKAAYMLCVWHPDQSIFMIFVCVVSPTLYHGVSA